MRAYTHIHTYIVYRASCNGVYNHFIYIHIYMCGGGFACMRVVVLARKGVHVDVIWFIYILHDMCNGGRTPL